VATVRAAVESGISLIDVAPSYGNGEAEEVVGMAFGGRLPHGVRVLTKHHVGHDSVEVEAKMITSLEASLQRLRLDFVDVLLLHSQLVPRPDPERESWTTPLELFEEAARPALQNLVDEGRVGAWGITAVQFPEVLEAVFSSPPIPQVAQMVANAIDSPGDMSWTNASTTSRQLIARAQHAGIGVMGIRAVQAGALTDRLDRDLPVDHPARVDFERAAPFRAVGAELGEPAAVLAHRYALSMHGVDTVVLGVKNRSELAECLAAAAAGPLPAEVIERIDTATASVRQGRP
jgi:aryl-alcohol dehydrogenase-like predicted oxidoreductase